MIRWGQSRWRVGVIPMILSAFALGLPAIGDPVPGFAGEDAAPVWMQGPDGVWFRSGQPKTSAAKKTKTKTVSATSADTSQTIWMQGPDGVWRKDQVPATADDASTKRPAATVKNVSNETTAAQVVWVQGADGNWVRSVAHGNPSGSAIITPNCAPCPPSGSYCPPGSQPGMSQPGTPGYNPYAPENLMDQAPSAMQASPGTGSSASPADAASSPINNATFGPGDAANSQFTGASSGRSVAPNMIGDFFGGANAYETTFQPDSFFVQDPDIVTQGPSVSGVFQIAPLGGQFGDSTPFIAQNGQPIQFSVPASGNVPSTILSSLETREAIGYLTPGTNPSGQPAGSLQVPGTFFELDSGDPAFQQAVTSEFEAQQAEPGTATITGGRATMHLSDGRDDAGANAASNINGPIATPPATAGDQFFVEEFLTFVPDPVITTPAPRLVVPPPVSLHLPSPSGIVGRAKIAENTSPMPRDRVFFNYSYFNGVPFTADGININRMTPGFEKTTPDGLSSFEMKFPFATTLSTDVVADGLTNDDETEFGNITMTFKRLFYTDDTSALSWGLAVAVPTADDVNVRLADGTDMIEIKNSSVHLMPFIGGLYTPTERFFAQAFLQFDFDANGNSVRANDFVNGLARVGELDDTNFMYGDIAVGYWVHRSTMLSDDYLTGIAPTLELHYNTSITDPDTIRSGSYVIGTGEDINILNLVLGTTFEFQQNSTLTIGYTRAVGGRDDREFDHELRLIYNRRFGPQSRLTRSTF